MSAGPKPRTHDCGSHGRLTVKQIASRAGIAENSVYDRIDRGVTGDQLVAPRVPSRRVRGDYKLNLSGSENFGLQVAIRLAVTFRDRAPSVDYLRGRFGMSRATAYRWRKAFIEAGVGA